MTKALLSKSQNIFHEESITGDFFLQAFAASSNLVCIAKLSTSPDQHKSKMSIYFVNSAFETTVGAASKIRGRDVREFLNVGDLFSQTEWLNADNIAAQKIQGILSSTWNDQFDVTVSWNIFEFESESYISFFFDSFPLPKREPQAELQHLVFPKELKELNFISFRRLLTNIKSSFTYSQTTPVDVVIKFDEQFPDQVWGPEAALYSTLHAVFDAFGRKNAKGPVKVTLSLHPDQPRVARILIRLHDQFIPELSDMEFYARLFEELGGSFTTETHTEFDTSIYFSIPFTHITGEIPTSSISEDRLPRMVPVGLKVLFYTTNFTHKIIVEHFLEGLHIHASFATKPSEAIRLFQEIKPDLVFTDASTEDAGLAVDLISEIRSLESTYLSNKSSIVSIVPDELIELRQKLLAAGGNACLSSNYTRKNLLEALIHFAPIAPN